MKNRAVVLGEVFHKAGRPRNVWIADRFKLNARVAHVVLARLDDPATKITVSSAALSNPLYFCRMAAGAPPPAHRS